MQVSLVDANKYIHLSGLAAQQHQCIADCEVLVDQHGNPLLVGGSHPVDASHPRVILEIPEPTSVVTLRYALHRDCASFAGRRLKGRELGDERTS